MTECNNDGCLVSSASVSSIVGALDIFTDGLVDDVKLGVTEGVVERLLEGIEVCSSDGLLEWKGLGCVDIFNDGWRDGDSVLTSEGVIEATKLGFVEKAELGLSEMNLEGRKVGTDEGALLCSKDGKFEGVNEEEALGSTDETNEGS